MTPSGGRSTPWRIWLPILILLGGMAGAAALVTHRPPLEGETPSKEPPNVGVLTVQPQTLRLSVHSQGVVVPRSEINLSAEVAGKVVQVHGALVSGGFFREGEALVTVDPRDYDHAIVMAQATLAEARQLLAQEEAATEQAKGEWRALGEGTPTPLAMHVPQLAEARAKVAAAQAALADAQLKRSRCEWRSPFAGLVRDKQVGVGQYVAPGDKLARIYPIDRAEVRLPLSAEQLAFLDLPMGYRQSRQSHTGPAVDLAARFGTETYRWPARIVRTEGAFDGSTGLLHAVAEVANPYGYRPDRPPLLVGTFVTAEIEGREQPNLFVLPQGALNAAQEAKVLDSTDHLHFRRLDVLRSEAATILVRGGLSAGDRVVVSGIELVIDGMAVRPQPAGPVL